MFVPDSPSRSATVTADCPSTSICTASFRPPKLVTHIVRETPNTSKRYRLPGIEREGIAQLSLLETALWPLAGKLTSSVIETCRQQSRNAFQFLTTAIEALKTRRHSSPGREGLRFSFVIGCFVIRHYFNCLSKYANSAASAFSASAPLKP